VKDYAPDAALTELGLSVVVDVFDEDDLFRKLDNGEVLRLSRLGGASGFSDVRAIRKSTGIISRRVLRDGLLPIDLALAIVGRLESATDSSLSDYNHVLLCHSHTDPQACIRLAHDLSQRLGLSESAITAFNHGCAGFLKLASEGSRLLEGCAAGARVALISVETPEYWHDAADRLFCGIVSAGATAGILEVGGGLTVRTIQTDDFEIPAERRPNPNPLFHKITEEVFDFQGELCHRTVMRMNPEPVFLNGIELMLDNLRSALLSIDPEPGQRVIVAPHQPSGKLLKALVAAARTEFPDLEFLNNLEHFGNTISSSVPTLMSRMGEVLERNKLAPIQDGDHVILLAAGICMSRMSDHMSAGHACFRWRKGALNSLHHAAIVAESLTR
jgi:3-oxoacyl-[acyl-carrier-protein] synthase-3